MQLEHDLHVRQTEHLILIQATRDASHIREGEYINTAQSNIAALMSATAIPLVLSSHTHTFTPYY